MSATSVSPAPPPAAQDGDWRLMDQTARDAAYNNAAAVADSAGWLARWSERSARLRASRPELLDVPYGPRPRNRIDILRSGAAGAPLFVFIHGGYWQRNSKEIFTCMAEGPLARGFDVALPGYTLAPEATLTDIVSETHAAVRFLRRNATGLGLSCSRLIVSGWSAGGHLAASSLELPEVDACLAISGVFELEPLAHTFLNAALRLTEQEIASLSPIRRPPVGAGPATFAWGTQELPELQRQSRAAAAAWSAAGVACETAPVEGANHFSILAGLTAPDGALTAALLALCQRC